MSMIYFVLITLWLLSGVFGIYLGIRKGYAFNDFNKNPLIEFLLICAIVMLCLFLGPILLICLIDGEVHHE